MKWTAFDQETATALAAHLPNVAHSSDNKDALDSALDCVLRDSALNADPATGSAAAVLAPARATAGTVLVTMKTKALTQPGSESDAPQPTGYQAGGFLGLSDDPVYEDDKKKEVSPPKKLKPRSARGF